MKVDQAGLDFIAAQESFVGHVYYDIAGVPTIGFGHVLKMGDPIVVTRDQALAILQHDVASAEAAVNADVKASLSQNQFNALVDFTFNCGTGALATSALLVFVNQGNFEAAAGEFIKWCHARVNGRFVEVEGLKRRRLAEAAMFSAAPPPPVVAEPVIPGEVDIATRPGDLPET